MEPLDVLGMAIWCLMFVSPLVVFLFLRKVAGVGLLRKCMYSVLFGIPISAICYVVALAIIFRDGMGP